MKRLVVSVFVVSFCVALLAAPINAASQNIKQAPNNFGTAIVNIPGSLVNGVKGAKDEAKKRGFVSFISGIASFGLNVAVTAVSSGITIGTLGIVPPVNNAWSKDPPPAVFPK